MIFYDGVFSFGFKLRGSNFISLPMSFTYVRVPSNFQLVRMLIKYWQIIFLQNLLLYH